MGMESRPNIMNAIKVTSPASKLFSVKSFWSWLVSGPETSPNPITRKARKMGADTRKFFFIPAKIRSL
jgi:hypothetical protein